jgi:hypothetical protein
LVEVPGKLEITDDVGDTIERVITGARDDLDHL